MTYWFDPMVGGGGGGIIGGIPNQAPAMSSAQINASMGWNPAAQAQTTNLYGPMGFGGQTAMYAGLGAAYGRQTGGFGMQPAAPAPAVDPWAGTGFDPIQYLHNNPDVAGATGGDPMKAYEHARSYGVNEGRAGTDMFDPGESWSPPQERINQGFDAYPNWSPQSYAPNFNDTFSPYGIYGHQLQNQSAINAVNSAGLPFQSPTSDQVFGSPLNFNSYAERPIPQGDTGQLFDSIKYLQNNPDVARAGADAWGHYDKFGRGEGREAAWGNVFDPNTYLRMNQDVQQAGMDPRTHWLKYGQSEGRQGGGVLNNSRDEIARLLTGQGLGVNQPSANPSYYDPSTYQPTGAGAGGWQDLYGLGGRFAAAGGGAGGGSLTPQQLINQGNAVNMPSGQFGGHPPNVYGAPSSGYLGIQSGISQDPFGGWRNPADMNAGGGFPADYQQGFYGQNNPFGNNSQAGG